MTAPGPGTLFDPGLQPERTALAWSRTCLALVVGALVGARVLGHALGPVAVLPMLLLVLAGTGLMVAAHRRDRRRTRALTGPDAGRAGHGDARLIAGVAALTTGLALAGLVALLTW